jgi:hypothetical protein
LNKWSKKMFHGISSAIYKQTYTLRVCKSNILISLTMFFSENCSRISCWTKYKNKHNVLIYIQQDATLHGLFISGNCSTRFGWHFHPSLEAQTTVPTASGICLTVRLWDSFLWITVSSFLKFCYLLVTWWWPGDRGRNM